jgi:acetyl esterase/lipase
MPTPQPFVLPLWPNGAPGSEGWTQPELLRNPGEPINIPIVRNVSQPTLTIHRPDPAVANGTAVVVAPGGAFHFLAIEHEGIQVAEWLTAHGITACILRYRLIQTAADDQEFLQHMHTTMADRERMRSGIAGLLPLISADGQQAIRVVRQHAAEWQLNQDRIGIIGFSAGAVVTTMVATQYDPTSRPGFAAPIYSAPVDNLVVPSDAPPLFIVLAHDDDMAVRASIPLYSAWHAAGKSAELHIYSQGGHGFGMYTKGLPSDQWIEAFADWLRVEGFLVKG